jgi:hypothetical protein
MVIHQIEFGELDHAVQVSDYINSINPNPVGPWTVNNALRQHDMRAVVKRKRPLLKKAYRIARLSGLWRTERG